MLYILMNIVLYIRTLLFIHSKCNSLHLHTTSNSLSIPLLLLLPLAATSLFSMSMNLFQLWNNFLSFFEYNYNTFFEEFSSLNYCLDPFRISFWSLIFFHLCFIFHFYLRNANQNYSE